MRRRPVVLMMEDNPADVELTREALSENRTPVTLFDVPDGVEALDYLHRRGRHANAVRPDLIVLDLNVPRIDGKRVIGELKQTPLLKRIPIVVLTSSAAEADIVASYNLGANCYLSKPLDLDAFQHVVRTLESFWLDIVRLPTMAKG